jgi:gamma-glutamylcyclotransferase (GGCT)/AIG2-like uncharacterized protein YtfP
MKLTSILDNIISEVGEGSAKPYQFRTVKDKPDNTNHRRDVSFKTEDGDDYKVMLEAYWGDGYIADTFGSHISIDFVIDHGFDNRDAYVVVNKGRLFRVMATVVQIAREFMKDIDYKEKGIDTLRIEPTKSTDDDDHRRANLYMAYIKRQLPISDISYDGDEIVAKIK